jgi:polar amino acid transport system substrate-binding protein
MQTKKVRLCAALSEPWYFKDTSGSDAPGAVKSGDAVWRGVGPSLASAIAQGMNVQLEIVETTWGNAVPAIQANQCDFMFILDGTAERALALEFISGPVLWYPVAALAKPELAGKTWAELNDPKHRLGVALGSSTDQTITRLVPKATMMRYANTGEMLAAWQSNRIDAAFTAGPTVDLAIARLRSGINLIPKPALAVPAGTGIRQEQDRRWSNYLATVVAYFYNNDSTQRFYN